MSNEQREYLTSDVESPGKSDSELRASYYERTGAMGAMTGPENRLGQGDRLREIPDVLGVLSHAVDNVDKAVSLLIERIGPVCNSNPSPDEGEIPDHPERTTDISVSLQGKINQLRDIEEKVHRVSRRVEL